MSTSTLSPTKPAGPVTAPIGASETTLQLLRMAVGPEVLAVPIQEVHEILEVGRLTVLPRTPEFVRGVMNLRGSVVPVIDLSALLGLGGTEAGRRTCIVVVEVQARAHAHAPDAMEATPIAAEPETESKGFARFMVGLMVHAVYEVFDVEPKLIEPVPPLGTSISSEWLGGMTRHRQTIVGILALDRALEPHQLAEMIATHATQARHAFESSSIH
jgi:purine-binding chemotaxis protein CheW